MKIGRFWMVVMLMLGAVVAAPTSVMEALSVASDVEAVKGKDYRLYTLSYEKSKDEVFFAFTFFDGEKSLHSVNVDADGKTRYQLREAAKISLFEEVDFSELPACNVHCEEKAIDELVQRAKDALDALKIERDERDSLRLTYHVRCDRKKDGEVLHCWSVTLPIKEKKQGMRVGFIEGELKSINPANLR